MMRGWTTALLVWMMLSGCVSAVPTMTSEQLETQPAVWIDPLTGDALPTPALAGITREQREVRFVSRDVTLAGELDLPLSEGDAALVFIIHHSGPATRNAYGYMAELLTKAGFAVFRFDKRGTGLSEGEYGCCEAEDALAAYRAAVMQAGIDRSRVFIAAQSIGSEHLATHFAEFAEVQQPAGVVLLSSLLGPERIVNIKAPLHIIVSDSEPNLDAITVQAVEAHRSQTGYESSYYIAEHSEHTLFDITEGPIDWSDPAWVKRYHRGAMQSMVAWLQAQAGEVGSR
jgi:pimeloyl-ACP methyl ester carboxylesterase